MSREILTGPVLRRISLIHSTDAVSFSWRAMLKYHNSTRTANILTEKREIGEKHKNNVQKQMEQLRFCLMQAREYFDAFEVASLATKPLQLYYCCMSLVLAEILWKGDGNHSLDKLREKDGHHGLVPIFPSKISSDLEKAASSLIAKPYVNTGARRGTFEKWHIFSRHSPYIGKYQVRFSSGGIQDQLKCIMIPENKRPPLLSEKGISLLECMTFIPGMGHYLNDLGLQSHLIRGRISQSAFEISDSNFRISINLTIQPGNNLKIKELKEKIFFEPDVVNNIEYLPYPSGFSVKWSWIEGIRHGYHCSIPDGFTENGETIYLTSKELSLNEFGLIYASLYICGMFARYYPDIWIREIEKNTPFSLMVEYFLQVARERLAILTLGELDETVYLAR